MLTLHDQTTFSDKEAGTHGDCFRACVLTILQRPGLELPHPIAEDGGWSGAFWPALRRIGFIVRTIDKKPCDVAACAVDTGWHDVEIPRLVMAQGISPRGVRHSVVWDRFADRMVHDPHPSRLGVLEVEGFFHYLAPYPPTALANEGGR